ncbi:hypothetical protein ABZ499_27665 [Streptomyces sp. NPDC019990]|uniref:hypothetical protein n=1 Tax=Streptomyces sp. NPDC019990 TaxID=3154693 RepID=UPI0033D00EB3
MYLIASKQAAVSFMGPAEMTHNFAATAGALLTALLVVAAFEVVAVDRSLGKDQHKLLLMFADELKESAVALRTGVPIPMPRRREVESRVRLYLLLSKTLYRRMRTLYFIWAIDVAVGISILQTIIVWASLADSPPSPLKAHAIVYGTDFVMFTTASALVLRQMWMATLTKWEERTELATRMDLSPARAASLIRSWRRHHD